MKLEPGYGYCIKCKDASVMVEKKFKRYKNNTPVEIGKCDVCGTRMARVITREEALQYEILGEDK